MSINGRSTKKIQYRTVELTNESFLEDFIKFAEQTMLCKNMEIDIDKFPKCAYDYIRKERPYTCWISEILNRKPGDYKYCLTFFFDEHIYLIQFYNNGRPSETVQKYLFMKNKNIPALRIGIIFKGDLISELNKRA